MKHVTEKYDRRKWSWGAAARMTSMQGPIFFCAREMAELFGEKVWGAGTFRPSNREKAHVTDFKMRKCEFLRPNYASWVFRNPSSPRDVTESIYGCTITPRLHGSYQNAILRFHLTKTATNLEASSISNFSSPSPHIWAKTTQKLSVNVSGYELQALPHTECKSSPTLQLWKKRSIVILFTAALFTCGWKLLLTQGYKTGVWRCRKVQFFYP